MPTLLIILAILFAPSMANAATAESCSYAHVAAAYALTNAGGTLSIPSGSCAWGDTLTIDKAISVVGSSTTITYDDATLFDISLSTTDLVRISGLIFALGTGDHKAINIAGTISQLRIDHCNFTGGGNAIYTEKSYIRGVIDNNTFTNVGTGQGSGAIYLTGDNGTAWGRSIAAGTENALFIEDNTFTINNSVQSSTQDAQVYIQEAAAVVVRHNTFDATGWTTGYNFFTFLTNNHGNDEYYNGGNQMRASPIFEFYNNTVSAYRVNEFHGIRGGSVLLHDNSYTITGATAPTSIHKFQDEETHQTGWFSPLDTTYPCEDQIVNSFIYNEAYSGPTPTYGTVSGGYVTDVYIITESANVIVKDQSYFMHAPQSSGGSESYTDRPGASGRGSDGTTAFTATGANAYYPYATYTYPHPLRPARSAIGSGPQFSIGSGATVTIQ